MGISANDFNAMLGKYLASADGKKFLQENVNINPYTEEEMRRIAEELYTAIVEAYKAEVATRGADYFDMSTIHVGKPHPARKGKTRLRVIFDSRGLRRRSLHVAHENEVERRARYEPMIGRYYRVESKKTDYGADAYFTGKGVYDIFGLFTQGYTNAKPVYGYWWDNKTDAGESSFGGYMRSKTNRQGSDFIKQTIEAFKRKYPSIEVEYPRLWGGTK